VTRLFERRSEECLCRTTEKIQRRRENEYEAIEKKESAFSVQADRRSEMHSELVLTIWSNTAWSWKGQRSDPQEKGTFCLQGAVKKTAAELVEFSRGAPQFDRPGGVKVSVGGEGYRNRRHARRKQKWGGNRNSKVGRGEESGRKNGRREGVFGI